MGISESDVTRLVRQLDELQEQFVYIAGSAKYGGGEGFRQEAKRALAAARRTWRTIERDALRALK